MGGQGKQLSFWEHLDVLRRVLIKVVAVVAVCGILAFIFKQPLFFVVLAPGRENFATYDFLNDVIAWSGGNMERMAAQFINTGLAQQFIIHMRMACWVGLLGALPFALFQMFCFISPALYAHERRYVVWVVCGGYVMFVWGVLVGYFLVFPLTFRFLSTYQVSEDVTNLITLDSYVSTLMTMCMSMGVVFEIPVISWLLAKLRLLSACSMRRFRKHVMVVILVAAAVITPTSDVFTLLLVSLPMWGLYEASIWLVKCSGESHAAGRK